jgi:hypothetical protein
MKGVPGAAGYAPAAVAALQRVEQLALLLSSSGHLLLPLLQGSTLGKVLACMQEQLVAMLFQVSSICPWYLTSIVQLYDAVATLGAAHC